MDYSPWSCKESDTTDRLNTLRWSSGRLVQVKFSGTKLLIIASQIHFSKTGMLFPIVFKHDMQYSTKEKKYIYLTSIAINKYISPRV